MFKNITINLTAPICHCTQQALSWGITLDEKRNPGLRVFCDTCRVELSIPSNDFKAHFALDLKYPSGHKKQEETRKDAKILRLVPKEEKREI